MLIHRYASAPDGIKVLARANAPNRHRSTAMISYPFSKPRPPPAAALR